MKPGIYDIPAADYLRDPCPQPSLNASIAKILVDRTPWHAYTAHPKLNPRHKAQRSKAMDLGSAAHAVMLNDTRELRVIRARDYKGQAAQIARDMAYKNGTLPILESELEAVQAMVKSGREQLLKTDAPAMFTNGKAEQTLIWKEQIAPRRFIYCRIRVDWMPNDYGTNSAATFGDYKTTDVSADPEVFGGRYFYSMGYDTASAFYRRGIRKTLGLKYEPRFVFIAQEVEPPHALSVVDCDPVVAAEADLEVERAIQLFGECLHSGTWPGYPNSTCYVRPLAYLEARRQARREYERGMPHAELIQRMIAWQAPFNKTKGRKTDG